jgi:hypothetical protein
MPFNSQRAKFILGCSREKPGSFSIFLLAEDISAVELSLDPHCELSIQEEPSLSEQAIISYSWDEH